MTQNPIAHSTPRFGMFLGVYTPSVLTILGLIIYLRFGWVVGNLGLGLTLAMVLLASSITFITALSASAVATNMRVGAGGEYFMVSHSLGLEVGGAIGIPLFLCRTLSITFYSFGLAESILPLLSGGEIPDPRSVQILAAFIIIAITALSSASANLALRLQVPIMVLVGLSILALGAGVLTGDLRSPEWTASYHTAPEGFWYIFAVFFPAVTGFAAGIGMSGDLKDARHAIPRGTLLAVGTGTLIYMVVPILLAVSDRIPLDQLAQPQRIVWIDLALVGAWLVFPGMWGAILSSAVGSALGGPRVLQAVASDGLAPRFLARLSSSRQPTVATIVSGAIALAAVAIGGLNAVAQFVSILFLTLYVTINLSATVASLAGDPSWRPTIRVPWFISLLGAVGAVAVMVLINPYACVIAVVLEAMLFIHFRRRALRRHWGDTRAGFWAAVARFALLKLKDRESDPRNWRPQILLFSGNVDRRIQLVRLGNWFNQNRGLVTACNLIVGDHDSDGATSEAQFISAQRREMDAVFNREGLPAQSGYHRSGF